MRKQRVLICGATGFIGRNIAENLGSRDDFEVIAVYHRRPPFEYRGLNWVQADLTRLEDVDRVIRGVDIVIQAAAVTSGIKDTTIRPHIHIADNAVMNSLVLQSAYCNKISHLIFFSCTVMLPTSSRLLSENDFIAGSDIDPKYFGIAWTKLYIEKMCEFYSRLGGTRYTAIRHSNIYGPHDKFDVENSHVFGATITKVMSSHDGRVVVWGTGEEARDLLYVDDLVDFVLKVIANQRQPYELYNCGIGESVTVKNLVAMIIEASGRNLEVEYDLSKPTIKNSLALDCAKAKTDLGWRPMVPLEEGIRRTISWWKTNVISGLTL